MTTTHMLYLHGFRSSPQSAKAQRMARYVEQNHPRVQLWCPQLPPSPREAMALIEDGIAGWPGARMAVVGSSLGGYYASAVAQRMHCKSVMLNPAVDPARDLAHYIGEQSSWHTPEERFFFRAEYIDELRALDVRDQPQAAPELLVAARGDELLDWREMVARYPQAQHIVLPGGDHALSDFEQVLAPVFAFLDLA